MNIGTDIAVKDDIVYKLVSVSKGTLFFNKNVSTTSAEHRRRRGSHPEIKIKCTSSLPAASPIEIYSPARTQQSSTVETVTNQRCSNNSFLAP